MLIFILNCITPLLTAAGLTPEQAGLAAQQVIDANTGNPLQIGQAVAFGLASLDSLRLSAPRDLPTPLKLKLRANASALNQIAARYAADLQDVEPPFTEGTGPNEAETLAALDQAKRQLTQAEAPTTADRAHQLAWASAMTEVAAEGVRELPKLSRTERRNEIIRISALCSAATEIITGQQAA